MQAKQTTTLLLLLVLVASLLHTTQGAEFHWTASGSASFDLLSSLLNFKVKAQDGSLVAALSFPGANDDIYFDAAGSYTVKIASSLSCKSIIIGGAGVSGSQTLNISSNVVISSKLQVAANGALNLVQGAVITGAAAVQVTGSLIVQAGASIQTTGALTIDATANAALTLQGTASVTAASISNSGKIVIAAGAKATLAVAAAAQFVMAASSQFIVEGNVTLSANAYAASDNTSRVIVNGYASVQNNGAVNFGRSSVSGSGTIEAGTVTMNGKVQAGNSPGHLLIRGDLTMDTFAEFYEEVVNVVIPGKDYDRVTVTGKATIKGTLFVDLQNGFLPDIGDRIDFIVYGSFEGGFALKFLTRDGNKLVLNRDYDLSYSGSAARVSFKAGLFNAAPTMSHSHVLFLVIMCMFALVARLL